MSESRDTEAGAFGARAWDIAPTVRALITTRRGGCSRGPYGSPGDGTDGLNLALHVGDDADAVAANRAVLPVQPIWLDQVHGTAVACLDGLPAHAVPTADASFTTRPGIACAVLTADCMPVLIADRQGRVVGVAHAGWRGLAAGVIEALVDAMRSRVADADLHACIGPHIRQPRFEVGPEVRSAFVQNDPAAAAAFVAGRGDRWYADLAALARRRLASRAIRDVSDDGRCTYDDADSFYSFRRDGVTGRFASVVWISAGG